jgi:DNA-directed RNA polymerase subunit RPC12/RpoP
MDWEPQGLAKYLCLGCYKEFIVGLIDEQKKCPICCPFCQSKQIENMVYAEPNQDYSKWLDDMGCMGIGYRKGDD